VFPEYYLERFPRGTTCRSHRQTASKPQDAVITPGILKVKARAGDENGERGGGGERDAVGRNGRKKIQIKRKRRNHIKKHLKENGRRREEEETGGSWIRKR